MVVINRIVLDVLKPHQPNVIEFSQAIAQAGPDYHVSLTVIEMDENTETLEIEVEGKGLDFEAIQAAVTGMGGSIHSLDVVEVRHEPDDG